MKLKNNQIEDIVHEIIVGAGEHDIEFLDLQVRVESRLKINLTSDEVEYVHRAMKRCRMMVEYP